MVVGSTPAAPNRKKTSMTANLSIMVYLQEWQNLCILFSKLCSHDLFYCFRKYLKLFNDCRFEIFYSLVFFLSSLSILSYLSLENIPYDVYSCALTDLVETLFGKVIGIQSCFILRVSGSQKKEVEKASQLLYQQFFCSLPSAVPFSKISEKQKSFVVLTSPHKFKQGGEHLQWVQTKYLFISPACSKEQLSFLYSSGNSLRLKGVQLSWDVRDKTSLFKTCGKMPLGPKELQKYPNLSLESFTTQKRLVKAALQNFDGRKAIEILEEIDPTYPLESASP
jgi:hypothetical protein